ncbi:MAG: hypothetical protein PQJ49_11235 [Sphaerochaetaceae bacterium]|nr:hypothetical protein [Sphaerochaetaceae bacterium]
MIVALKMITIIILDIFFIYGGYKCEKLSKEKYYYDTKKSATLVFILSIITGASIPFIFPNPDKNDLLFLMEGTSSFLWWICSMYMWAALMGKIHYSKK